MKNTLKRLIISHFKSVVDTIEIIFSSNGMTLVEGRNKATGGSSGAGKSLALTALNIALGCSSHPMTKAQSWYTDAPPEVALEWENSKFGMCMIERGKRSRLTLGMNTGTPETYTAAGTIAEKMKEAFGVDSGLLRVLTYSPQQDFTDFLSKANAEKQKFLTTVLDLQPFEAAVGVAMEQLKEFVIVEAQKLERFKATESGLETTKALLTEAQAAFVMRDVTALETERSHALIRCDNWDKDRIHWTTEARKLFTTKENRLKAARSQFLQEEADADQYLDDMKQELAKVQQSIPSMTTEEAQTAARIEIGKKKLNEVQAQDMEKNRLFLAKCRELDSQIATINGLNSNIKYLEESIKAKKDMIAHYQGENEKLEKNLCPTCDQQWVNAQTQIASHLRSIEGQNRDIAVCEGGISDCRAKLAQLPRLQAERMALRFEADPLIIKIQDGIRYLEQQQRQLCQVRVDTHRVALESAAKNIALAEEVIWEVQEKVKVAARQVSEELRVEDDKFKSNLMQVQESLATERLALQKLESEIKLAQSQNDQGAKHLTALSVQVSAQEKAFETAMKDLAEIQAKANQEREFISAVGREGFLGRIFDEVLEEIGTETNLILGRVANTAHVTIQFQSEFQNGKGNTEKEIRTRAYVSGNETECDATGISGGMMSAVRLAVKIAIRRVVFRRAGIHLGWNILDESFDGLDPVSKEACFEILSEDAQDNLYLIVDHSPEFKSMFGQGIIMAYKDGITTLEAA